MAVALFRLEADGSFYALSFVRNSWLFVDFFFVLSGFVIAFAYLDRIEDVRSTAKFTVRRFGRLWPLHVTMLGVFVLIEFVRLFGGGEAFTGYKAPWTIVPEIALAHSLGFTGVTNWNTPSWSISTEFWTYLIFAALVLGFRRHMAIVSAVAVAASLAVLVAVSPKGMDVTFDYGLLRCIAGFFAGVGTLLAWRALKDRVVLPMPTVLEFSVLAAIVVFVSAAGHSWLSFAAPFVFAPAVLIFSFQKGALSTALLARPLQALGTWSYGIYMTAYFVALFFNLKAVPMLTGVPMDLVAIVYLACVLVASWLAYRVIEAPGRAYFNKLAAKL